jgi:hypothetical protein
MTSDPLGMVVLAIYAWAISWIEERFGKFQDLPPNMKQLVNAIFGLVIPAVVLWLTPYWKPEFGALEPAVEQLLVVLTPIAVWLATQVFHYADLLLKSWTSGN